MSDHEVQEQREKKTPKVRLVGADGNAFYILGLCVKAMRKAGWSQEEIDDFLTEAESGNYDHLLGTVMKYCDVY